MFKHLFFVVCIAAALFYACTPQRDDTVQLPDAPSAPDFSIEMLGNDSSRVIVRDLSSGNFQRLWDFPNGQPKSSTKAVDTIYYNKKGEYPITLYVSKADGSGTVSTMKTASILVDAIPTCNPVMALLTGDCEAAGKCWKFSTDAGAIRVGPSYDDFSWFTSTTLVPEQYDDSYCFNFDGLTVNYNNNGLTVNPWDGYQAQAYDSAPGEFTYSVGTGTGGRDQIILPDNYFMGVRDADNVMDVVTLTETELVVRARLCGQDGVPAAQGWFELKFVKQ